MKAWAALSLALLAANGLAATSYVTDELVLGLYPEPNDQGQRLATLHSGAAVETLAVSGDFTRVRLVDGGIGWVKTVYLTPREPAVARLKQVEDELDRARATTAPRGGPGPTRLNGMGAGSTATNNPPAGLGWVTPLAALVALVAGFWMGHAALARRIRRKFGGIKVY